MSDHGHEGGGGGGLIGNVLGSLPGPGKLVEGAMEHGGTDEVLGILGAATGVVGIESFIDKHIPDPFDFKAGGKTPDKPLDVDAHSGGHH